ncbi:MAG: hypothetical protein ACOYOZ_17265, partial [Pirellula sp.]
GSAAAAQQLLEEVATSYAMQATDLTAAAQSSAQSVQEGSRGALAQTVDSCRNQVEAVIASVATQQQELVDQALSQIDQGMEKAHNEIRGVNDRFRGGLREAANESISRAKLPLTDPLMNRALAAAHRVGQFLLGVLAAIGELIVGFLILVAVALVVAAIFGLTLGGALLIVGAAFLLYAVYTECRARSKQLKAEGIPAGGGFIFLLALSDATGITAVGEAIWGVDVVTGQPLSDRERGRRGTVGLVTAIGIVFGARAAIKGPPGGWTRPTGVFGEGPFNVIANVRGAVGDLAKIGSGLFEAAKRGVEAISEWVKRVSGAEETPTRSEPSPSAATPKSMSTKLQTVWNRLTDSRARAQLETMFDRMDGDSPKLEGIVESMERKATGEGRTLQDRLIDDWESRNPYPRGNALDEFPGLRVRAQKLLEQVGAFGKEHPEVKGINEMTKKIEGEIGFCDRVLKGEVEATPERAQGVRNNLSGIEAEFNSARAEMGAIGVNRKFSLDGIPESVEVDVVADNGKRWIDVKRVEPFGLESSDWVGGPGKQGLKVQSQELLRAANQNPVNGAPPRIVIDFPRGVSSEVAAALRAMGIEVRGPDAPIIPINPSKEDEDRK